MKFLQKKCLLPHFGRFEMGGGNQSPTSHESTTIIFDICDELSCIPTDNTNYSNNNSNKTNTRKPHMYYCHNSWNVC